MRISVWSSDVCSSVPNSVRHMGATTLSAVERFAGDTSRGAEVQRVYTDVGRHLLLELPQIVAAIIMGVGLVAAGFLYWRGGTARRIRSAFIPLLALVVGKGLAIGVAMLVAALRPEAAFGKHGKDVVRERGGP